MKPTLLVTLLLVTSSLFGATITWSQPGVTASSNGYSVTLSPGSGSTELNFGQTADFTLGTLTVEMSGQPEVFNVPLIVPFTLNGTEYPLDFAFNAGPVASWDGAVGAPWLIVVGNGNHDFEIGQAGEYPLALRFAGYTGGVYFFGDLPDSQGTSAPFVQEGFLLVNPQGIPEPSTVVLAGAGVGAMFLARLRQRRKARMPL